MSKANRFASLAAGLWYAVRYVFRKRLLGTDEFYEVCRLAVGVVFEIPILAISMRA